MITGTNPSNSFSSCRLNSKSTNGFISELTRMRSDSALICWTYPWHVCGKEEQLDPISAYKLEKSSLGICVFAVCCQWWHVPRESSNITRTGPSPTYSWLTTAWCQPEYPTVHLKVADNDNMLITVQRSNSRMKTTCSERGSVFIK